MMQEGPQSPPLTHEMLLEKLAEADQRRQQVNIVEREAGRIIWFIFC